MVTRPRVAMVLEMGEGGAERAGGARGAAIVALRAPLDDVRHFARHRASYARGAGGPQWPARNHLEALVPGAAGRLPLTVTFRCDSVIVRMIAFRCGPGR